MLMKLRNDFAEFNQIITRLAEIADSRFMLAGMRGQLRSTSSTTPTTGSSSTIPTAAGRTRQSISRQSAPTSP
jgi:hypothetical protein